METENEFNSPQEEMVDVIIEEATSVLAQYGEDRREYAAEELYNDILKGGRKGLLLAAIGWLENEYAACDDVDEGECPHRDMVEVCEPCQRLGAVFNKYAQYNDDSREPEIVAYDRTQEEMHAAYQAAQAPRQAPTPIGGAVILCGCGSELAIASMCAVCLESSCPKCQPEHGPGKCDVESDNES